LKEPHAGLLAVDLCRKHGITDATFYKWRARYGGMDASDAKNPKALEYENSKLKCLLAESAMDNVTPKEMLTKNF
jgi:putative transposase